MVFQGRAGSFSRRSISELFLNNRQLPEGQRRMRIGGQLVGGIGKIAPREKHVAECLGL